MNETVLTDYEINKETIAIIPANHIDYYSIVLERDQQLHVKLTPLQLIKASCLEGGSTYDGRRLAVTHQTGAQNKVPIPIHPLEQIYAFPTHSPSLHDATVDFLPPRQIG
jgi:competence protein ComK